MGHLPVSFDETFNPYTLSHTESFAMVIPIMRLVSRMRFSHFLYPSCGEGVSINCLIIFDILAGCPMRTIWSFRSLLRKNIFSSALSTATLVCDVIRTVAPFSTALIAATAIVVVFPVPGGPSIAL